MEVIAPEPAPVRTDDGVTVHPVASWAVPRMHIDVGYRTVGRLRSLMEQIQPDVVHLASPFVLGHQALRAATSLSLATVAVYQTDVSGFARHYRLTPVGALSDALIKRIHRDSDLTLVPSTASREYLESMGIARVALWGRGVDTDQFNPRRRSPALRTAWLSPNPDRVVVGYVGRLAPEKQVASLGLLRDDPRIRLIIIGDGPQRAELQSLLPTAVFTGMLQGADLGTAMASLDVLVAPGERETFCQVVQEAMSAGVPVIAPDTGGPRDLVIHGEVGLRYRPQDNDHLIACTDALVSSPAARAVMGSNGRNVIRDRTWTQIGDELVTHYRKAMARKSPHEHTSRVA